MTCDRLLSTLSPTPTPSTVWGILKQALKQGVTTKNLYKQNHSFRIIGKLHGGNQMLLGVHVYVPNIAHRLEEVGDEKVRSMKRVGKMREKA